MPKRTPAVLRKVSLADFSDGWDECYAVVRLASYQEFADFANEDLSSLNNIEKVGKEIEVVKRHFVSGKILVLEDGGSTTLEDMTSDDVAATPKLADYLFSIILGVDLDPKGSSKAAPSSSASTTPSNNTKTPSSTALAT